MAYNDILAKDDPDLRISVYYLRMNVFRELMSPMSGMLFANTWEALATTGLAGFRRSQLAGALVSDLIRAMQLEEISETECPVNGWFVHSGTTTYRRATDPREARIRLPSGRVLAGQVRDECNVTASAKANMVKNDDVSFVLGRVLTGSKFDLVAAGGRTFPMPHSRSVDMSLAANVNVLEAAAAMTDRSSGRRFPTLGPSISHSMTLSLVMLDATDHLVRVVESEGGWKFLYDGAKPAHESRHQGQFRLLTRTSFNAHGINVEPGADHGRGPTDFTLTLGNSRHVVEFKKDSDMSKTLHGVAVQLPLYMDSASAEKGTYVVMCHYHDPDTVRSWMINKYDPSRIHVVVVDCRRQLSASRA